MGDGRKLAPRVVTWDCPSDVVMALVEEHNKTVAFLEELRGDTKSPLPRKINLTPVVKNTGKG